MRLMSCVLLHVAGLLGIHLLKIFIHLSCHQYSLQSHDCHKHGINTSITVTTQSCFILIFPLEYDIDDRMQVYAS